MSEVVHSRLWPDVDRRRVPLALRHQAATGKEYKAGPFGIRNIQFFIDHPKAKIVFDLGFTLECFEKLVGFPHRKGPEGFHMKQAPDQNPIAQLAKIGVKPEDIDYVVISHLMSEHAGYLPAVRRHQGQDRGAGGRAGIRHRIGTPPRPGDEPAVEQFHSWMYVRKYFEVPGLDFMSHQWGLRVARQGRRDPVAARAHAGVPERDGPAAKDRSGVPLGLRAPGHVLRHPGQRIRSGHTACLHLVGRRRAVELQAGARSGGEGRRPDLLRPRPGAVRYAEGVPGVLRVNHADSSDTRHQETYECHNRGPEFFVDVCGGRIVRITPIEFDESDAPSWRIEARGRTSRPPRQSDPFSFTVGRSIHDLFAEKRKTPTPLRRTNRPKGNRNCDKRGESGYEPISWRKPWKYRDRDTYGGSSGKWDMRPLRAAPLLTISGGILATA